MFLAVKSLFLIDTELMIIRHVKFRHIGFAQNSAIFSLISNGRAPEVMLLVNCGLKIGVATQCRTVGTWGPGLAQTFGIWPSFVGRFLI